jgi:Rps23 Pro-64 3,4-dihydroxylase Tpa1-like proline 4-hydroxylase
LKSNTELNKIYEKEFVHRIQAAIKTSVDNYELSCMKCDCGDYFRAHVDGWQGNFNTIFYANKDWTYDWGGLLHVVEDKDNGYFETITPKFNRLVILYNDKFKCPHFVTPVTEYAQNSRYTLASWINLKGKNESL